MGWLGKYKRSLAWTAILVPLIYVGAYLSWFGWVIISEVLHHRGLRLMTIICGPFGAMVVAIGSGLCLGSVFLITLCFIMDTREGTPDPTDKSRGKMGGDVVNIW